MDSPIRQYLKQKDYRRHKLFRKINRRRKAERLLAIDAPMKEMKRRLKRFGGGKDAEEEQPVISGQQPDMSWHKYWLSNRADILGHNIKDTEIHPIWALQELTGYNFPGFEKIGKERIEEELNNALKFREYTSPNEMPEKAILFLHRNLPSGITDQQAYDAKMGGNAGVTYPYLNIVMYHPFSTNVARGHERTHTLNATAQEKKVKLIMMDQYKDRSWFDDYYEDPSEIYARLMNFRYMAKLNPKKKVTVEDLEKWRSDFDLNYGVYAPADNLLRRYNNDTLLRLFNEVALNNTENVLNEDGLLMANSGKDDWLHSQLKTYWGGELPEVVVTARDLRKPQTFAGRIAQVAGASPAVSRGADLVSTAVLLSPYGIIPAAMDLGMDSNSLYHRDEGAEKDVALDLLSMIPGISKLGLKKKPTRTLKQMWDEALQAYRELVKFLSGVGKAGDAIDDTYGSVNVMSHFDKGKDSGIHIKPENRGKFTALKKRTGKSASWFKAHGTPALKKMATFALNARKWKHK